MRVLRDGHEGALGSAVTAIGVFDGLHLGHQRVLREVCSLAAEHGATPSVVTFDPHPALVLAPERAPGQLATLEQRLEGFERLGIDQVRVIEFTHELAHESADSFVERVLIDELSTVDVVVGEDFVFGHGREGNVDLLRRAARVHDFHVHAAPIFGDGRRWSSTSVRAALAEGDLDRANAVLGRPFTLRGVVATGDARGTELGFPTANLTLAPRQLVPEMGIYAGALRLEGAWRAAAISVGRRPQFYDAGDLLVEVFVLDFAGDLYGATLDVSFLARLRGESVFPSTQELVDQMHRDVAETSEIFSKFDLDAYALLG